MNKFIYYAPTEIIFGKDTENGIAELVKKYDGNRVFIVYGGKSAERSGLLDRVENNLRSAGLKVKSIGGVVPNPLLSKARELIWSAIDFKADFILAIGGGSVIDTAKAVAHGTANPDINIWDYWMKKEKVTKSLPVGVILTIAAAGSETSDSAVLTNDTIESPTKRGINTPLNRCRFAIMNPELTMTLPKYQIGAGVADIFMHTSERYFTKIQGNHLTDEIAEGLFRDIIKYGVIGIDNPKDYEAMSEIMWCGSVSHIGLTGIGAKGDTDREGDWACHQMGMAMSALYDCTHGATLTAIWASWAKYVMDEDIDRFARFAAKVYGINDTDKKDAAEEGITRTVEFFNKLGMPVSLTELFGEVPDNSKLENMALECSYNRSRTIGSFKELDYDDILNIYKASI
jgi:alcohol dehydrogenase YqhD (iron-dependent ADH family)